MVAQNYKYMNQHTSSQDCEFEMSLLHAKGREFTELCKINSRQSYVLFCFVFIKNVYSFLSVVE